MKEKWCLTLAILAMACSSEGASVVWDYFGHPSGSSISLVRGWLDETGYDYLIYPNIQINATPSANGTRVTIAAEETAIAAFGDNWVIAEAGDVADASTTRNQDSYFLHGWMDGNTLVSADDSITRFYNGTFSFFLAFATTTNEADDLGNPIFEHVWYGWVQIEYSKGILSVIDSAVNLTANEGIVVGTDRTIPVPEPASGFLALFGALLLTRRRTSGTTPPARRRRA